VNVLTVNPRLAHASFRFLFYGSASWPKGLLNCFNQDDDKRSVPYFTVTAWFLFMSVIIIKQKFPLVCVLFNNLQEYLCYCTTATWDKLLDVHKEILRQQHEVVCISQ
jgi:hypothetical protein